MSVAQAENVVQPDPNEQVELERLRGRIDEIYVREGKALLVGPDANEDAVELPASAFEALKFVVHSMAKGNTIVLMPQGKELTTQEAADLLHVSRPHVIKLCDRGDLPYFRVGAHRRVRIEDVLDYRERRAAERHGHLRDLTKLSEDVEGGYR